MGEPEHIDDLDQWLEREQREALEAGQTMAIEPQWSEVTDEHFAIWRAFFRDAPLSL